MDRSQILDKAKELINGPRAQEYGPPKDNFARIATMWSLILKTDISAEQVALMMIALKMTRLIQSTDHKDSWIDIAGYAGCGGEIAHGLHP